MTHPVRSLLAALALAAALLWPAAAHAAVSPAPTSSAPSATQPTAAPTTAPSSSPSPGSQPPGAQYRPDEGSDWSGTLTILGFFAVATAGLLFIVRKGLGSADSED